MSAPARWPTFNLLQRAAPERNRVRQQRASRRQDDLEAGQEAWECGHQ